MNAPNPTTYADLSADPTRNLQGTGADLMEAIEGIYTQWDTNLANAKTSAELREEVQLDTGANFIGGIGVFVDHPEHPGDVLHVLHGLHRHAGSAFRRRYFLYRGDVVTPVSRIPVSNPGCRIGIANHISLYNTEHVLCSTERSICSVE